MTIDSVKIIVYSNGEVIHEYRLSLSENSTSYAV